MFFLSNSCLVLMMCDINIDEETQEICGLLIHFSYKTINQFQTDPPNEMVTHTYL